MGLEALVSLADYIEDISRILERDAPNWLRGGSAKASIIRHPKMTECLRIDILYKEPASVGVRFLPARAFDMAIILSPAGAAIANVLRGTILVETVDPADKCERCGKAGQPALVDGVCRRCEAYPGVR